MKLDSIALASVTYEIKKQMIPAKIIDLYQLNKHETLLVLKNNFSTGKIFFSVRPDRMAFFLSDSPAPLKNFTSLFFNQLKNWIQGGMLLDVKHEQFDRIIKLIIQPYHKFGPIKQYQLIIEFMGKHSNAILIDEQNHIKTVLKQIGSDVNRYREIKAGITYVPPPEQNKVNPLTVSRQKFINMLSQNEDSDNFEYLWELFQQHFHGIGNKSSKEFVAAMNFPYRQTLDQITEQKWTDLWTKFSEIRKNITNNNLSPIVLIDKNTDSIIDYYLLFPIDQQNTLSIPFENTSSCLEFVFNRLRERDKKQETYHIINKVSNKNIKKLEEKKRFLLGRKKEIENCEEYKKKGELIKANLWNIKPGIQEIKVIDYTNTNQPQITVNLNPDLTPLQNAKHYFKKYKKLQQNHDAIEKQISENQKHLLQLKEIEMKLAESRDSLEELSEIYHRLIKLKYINKEKEASAKRKTEKTPAISKFLSREGWTILVGKNNRQNEYILRFLSSGNDFWLHNLTKPGSHVIIKNHKNLESPPHSTLIIAARLAGYYSKTKDKENALIIHTFRKYVKKPKNAKMGKVIYSNEKTLTVMINHSDIKKDIRHLLITKEGNDSEN